MQSRSLIKITREFFSNYPPVYVESSSEQKNIITALREKIEEIKKIKDIAVNLDKSYITYRNEKIDKERYLFLEVLNPYSNRRWYNRSALVISFEEENGRDKLYIKPAYENQTFNFSGNPEDLFDFFDRILEKYREQDNKKSKKEKINKLKKSAVMARIKEIAQKNRFNFLLKEYQHKLQLSIQIGEKGIVTMDILFSKFQQEMGKIESIVNAARELEKAVIVTNLNFTAQNNVSELRYFTKYDEP